MTTNHYQSQQLLIPDIDFPLSLLIHIYLEADKKGVPLILPPEKPKPQTSVNFAPKKFSTCLFLFKTESNTAIKEDEQQDSIDEEIEAK